MSESVDFDASKSVECVENIDMSDSSEVYLGLFWRRATRDMISFQEFKDLAETWLRILHLERLVEQAFPLPEPEKPKGVPRPPEEPEEPEIPVPNAGSNTKTENASAEAIDYVAIAAGGYYRDYDSSILWTSGATQIDEK